MPRSNAEIVRAGIACALFFFLPAGCGPVPQAKRNAFDTALPPITIPAVELFRNARVKHIDPQGSTVLFGEIADGGGDVEVWELGAIPDGSTISVDIQSGVDLAAGLFDHNYEVVVINHDRFGGANPYLNARLRQDTEALYLAVSIDPRNAESLLGGAYRAVITSKEDGAPMAHELQHVILNFTGGNSVVIGNNSPVQVPPFNAGDLSEHWAVHTEEIKQIVRGRLEETYSGLNVRFYFAEDTDIPWNVPLSWVHFGAEDERNVGLAAGVDYGNQYKQQHAIVYTQNFAKYVAYGYTYNQLAQGFANVAAHELGHLLGLNHTDDPADVMNVSPTVGALLAPQYFVEMPGLDPNVFPTGLQDGARRIFANVGGDWQTVMNDRFISADVYADAMTHAKSRDAVALEASAAPLYSAGNCKGHSAR